MPETLIETDYLVVGAGAAAMAFVDSLLTESDAHVVLVDRRDRPGGHWNDAYPFVRLHGPSAFYGVNSTPLGSGSRDTSGPNEGLHELATGLEVLNYYEQLLLRRFLPSGRVHWLPMSDYRRDADGSHVVTSLVGGARQRIGVRRKIVDATHARTAVPATHPPSYGVAPGVRCIALNLLPTVQQAPPSYLIVGAGKTGIDACLWLLQNGADPERIRWVMPRDAWMMDRANLQPGPDFFESFVGSLTLQLEAIGASASLPELLARLEADGQTLRLDPEVEPTMYRCATVTRGELAQLRRIRQVVRLGHVKSIEPTSVLLGQGRIDIEAGTLVVDCSAPGLCESSSMPIFDGDRINVLMVRTCQPAFSAALLAYVECHFADDAQKNALCGVTPNPTVPADWLRMWAVTLGNRMRWGQHPGLMQWLVQSRLDGVTGLMARVSKDDASKQAILQRYGLAARQAMTRLPSLLATLN